MEVGVEFGQYRVIEHIGRGGMADVWSARDKRLNRTVAIKTVARDLSQDMNPVKLFEREAQTIANLEHPNILPIYEFGEFDGQLYIVMRYVSGGSLEDVLEEGPISPDETMRLGRAVAQALDWAHENKVVHLDLKPSNILLDSYQLPYLADFGLAAVMGPEGRAANPGSGTLLYMAPEQLTAEVLDQRADVYSFSIMLFHMMTGELPFDAMVPLALKQIQMNEVLPDVTTLQAELPSGITAVLRRGTEADLNKRPMTLGEIVEGIEAALGVGAPAKSRTRAGAASGTRSTVRPEDLITRTEPMDDLITGPIENLVTRSAPLEPGNLDDILSKPLDELITAPQDRVRNPGDIVTKIDLGDLTPLLDVSPEAMAKREAIDIFNRAYRTWLHGQGRFLLGITHFMLINDYYVKAVENHLDLDESGTQLMLRGALEYDHDIDTWWNKLNDQSRRLVTLHALLSENPPARVRALQRLETLPDADVPQIPRLVAQQLQVETDTAAQLAAIRVFEVRGRAMPTVTVASTGESMLSSASHRLQLNAVSDWRETVFNSEVDGLLAQLALDDGKPAVAEAAARTIGRIRSESAVRVLAEHQRNGERTALRALALVRDEAPSLPKSVSQQARLYTWLNNTWRRISEQPGRSMSRYLLAAIFAGIAVWWYAYSEISSLSIFFAERWGKSLSTGTVFGVAFGLVVLLAAEVPERLRGFWPWWARLLLNLTLGIVSGVIVWNVFALFFLYYQPTPEDFNALLLGGIGAAAAFSLSTLFRIPGWLGVLWAAAAIYIPLHITWVTFMPPLIYVRPNETIQQYAIPIAILIGIGAYLPQLIGDLRRLWRRWRARTPQTTPPGTSVS
jgi:serine/threonine-protein kinase